MPTTVPAPGPSSLPPVLALLVPAALEGSSALVAAAEAVTKDVTRLRLVDEDESGVVLEVVRMDEELRREVDVDVVNAVVVMTDGVLLVVLGVEELSVVLVLVVEGVLVVVSSVVDGSGSSDDVVGVMSGSLVLVVVGSANVLRLVGDVVGLCSGSSDSVDDVPASSSPVGTAATDVCDTVLGTPGRCPCLFACLCMRFRSCCWCRCSTARVMAVLLN